MLIYHPAFDLYSCIFRVLQLLTSMPQKEIEVDRLRIWDFYLTFPNEARKISFPNTLSELKRIFKSKIANPYEDLLDSKRIIDRMKPYQLSALRSLASYGFVDGDLLTNNIVKLTDKQIPQELKDEYERLKSNHEKQNIIKLLIGFSDLPLVGTSGLKSRTGLIEFKYDSK
jgi:hypothetical protein